MIDGNLLSKTVQCADVVFEGFGFVEAPDRQPQLDLGHRPEKGVDRVDYFLRLGVRTVRDAAQAGVERDAAHGYSGAKRGSAKREKDETR